MLFWLSSVFQRGFLEKKRWSTSAGRPEARDNREVYASLLMERQMACMLVGILQKVDKSVSSEKN